MEAMQGETKDGKGPTRRLMHMTVFKKIANRFHGDVQIA